MEVDRGGGEYRWRWIELGKNKWRWIEMEANAGSWIEVDAKRRLGVDR